MAGVGGRVKSRTHHTPAMRPCQPVVVALWAMLECLFAGDVRCALEVPTAFDPAGASLDLRALYRVLDWGAAERVAMALRVPPEDDLISRAYADATLVSQAYLRCVEDE